MKIKKLNPTGVKILKMFHLLFAIMWIGGALAMMSVIYLSDAQTSGEMYMRLRALQIIDDYLIVPGAMATLVVGIIYGIFTNWGFFKHRWLLVKWILTILQAGFGTFFLGPWLNNNVDIIRATGEAAFTNPVFLNNLSMSKTGGTAQAIILLSYIVISVLKPWKKKK